MEIANGGISVLPLEDKICDEEPLDSVFIDDSRESEDTIQFSARRPPVKNSPSSRESISTTHNQQLVFIPKRTRATVSMRDDETDMWGSEEVDHKEEFTLTLTDPDHRNALLDRLNTFRRNRELCDVVLFVREKEILAHKVVLAAVSPSLFDMFVRDDRDAVTISTTNSPPPMNDMNKSACSSKSSIPSAFAQATLLSSPTQPQLSYFEFSQADYDCFNALVNFAYTSHLEISSKKVGELYKTAFSLQMGPIVNACASYLAHHLSVANCIGVRKQANFSNDEQLVNKVDKFIADNFAQIVDHCVEFTQLTCIKVRIIVNLDDTKQTRCGLNLAERAVQYFQSLPTNSDRAELIIEQLAEKTHLLYVEEDQTLQDCADMDDHSSVASCDIIQDYKRTGGLQSRVVTSGSSPVGNLPIQHHVTGATAVHLNASRVNNNKFSSNESINSVATTSTDSDEEILSKLIAVHQTAGDFWIALAVLHHRLVTISLQLTENEDIVRPSQRLPTPNPITKVPVDTILQQQNQERAALLARLITTSGNERTPLPEMNGARCSIGAAFVNGKIIVCGGYDRGECLKSTEEYDVIKGEWRQISDMSCERGRFDAAVAYGKVYAIAGSNGNVDLKTAECYDPKSGKWTSVKSLQTGRSHNACTSLDNFVYCIGGSSEQVVLKECERYDPENDHWEAIAPMQTARFQAGCTAWRGMVVACGGSDRWTCLDSVEAYDPKSETWKYLARLKTPRRGCAIAVVRDSLYVIGGHDGTQSLSSVEILDHPNGQWRVGPSLNMPRANTHAVVTAGNVIYVLGGFDGGHFLPSIELLDNESLGWRNWCQRKKSVSTSDTAITEEEEFEEAECESSLANNVGDKQEMNTSSTFGSDDVRIKQRSVTAI